MALANKGIAVGQPAPSFRLRGVTGRAYSLADFKGQALLLFFFRGTWCPNCRKQMEQVRNEWNRIEPLAAVIGVVGQGENEVRDFLARNPLPFPLLPDPNREVIKQFEVYKPFGLDGFRIAYPSTIIIDSEGIVRYSYVGESQFDRPDLNQVIGHLQSLAALA